MSAIGRLGHTGSRFVARSGMLHSPFAYNEPAPGPDNRLHRCGVHAAVKSWGKTRCRTGYGPDAGPGARPGVSQLCGDLLQNMLRQKVMLNAHRANPTLAYDGLTKE